MTEIQLALNSLILNEVVNATLFLILLVLYIISCVERWQQDVPGGRDFSMFLLFFTGYIGLMLLCLPAEELGISASAFWTLNFLRVLSAIFAYSYIGGWLLSIIEDKKKVSANVKGIIRYIPFVIFGIYLVLFIYTGSNTIANIPILCYYLMLQAVVIAYHHELGKQNTVIITMSIIPTLLLQAQEWWNYTPANIYLVLVIICIYSLMWTSRKEQYRENQYIIAKQEVELENARTRLILSQIKPHFIYNTMGTITYLCKNDPELAQELAMNFSDYLRLNLGAQDIGELVPFAIELKHVKTYLNIECVRFEDKLKVAYDIQTKDFKVPVLTVEPLVENAVKHGICRTDGGGAVVVATRELGDCYQVIVSDKGVGFDVKQLDFTDTKHVGLRSVQRRVVVLCHGSMDIKSRVGVGTTITLTFPKGEAQ